MFIRVKLKRRRRERRLSLVARAPAGYKRVHPAGAARVYIARCSRVDVDAIGGRDERVGDNRRPVLRIDVARRRGVGVDAARGRRVRVVDEADRRVWRRLDERRAAGQIENRFGRRKAAHTTNLQASD